MPHPLSPSRPQVSTPEESVALYGEQRPPAPIRQLAWGEWTATLENALIRNIRFRGTEIVRGVEFVGRTHTWGTLPPNVQNLDLSPERLNIDGVFRFPAAEVPWSACASFTEDGLTIAGRCEASAPVRTNRTGFVLLHPLSCLGQPFEIEHPDSTTTAAEFPTLIKPDQPAFNIRALRYAPADNLWLELRFEGDTFEMEDQRNWLDASFKTYCRPQSKPKPYTLAPAEPVEQSVQIRIESRKTQIRVIDQPARGEARIPAIGLGVPLGSPLPTKQDLDLLGVLAPAFVHVETFADRPRADLAQWRKASSELHAELALDIIGSGDAPTARRALGAMLSDSTPAWVTVDTCDSPTARSPREYIAAEHPDLELGIGTRQFFTELNHCRPEQPADFVRWTMNPTVHAMDDTTAMQNNQTAPWSVASARAFAEGRPLVVGPQTLRPRPPAGQTDSTDHHDPRQRGLFTAAWTLAHLAGLLHEDVHRATFFEPVGPTGLIHRRSESSQPWFDDLAAPAGFPALVVLAALSASRGRGCRPIDAPGLTGIEITDDGSPSTLIANTTTEAQPLPVGYSRWSVLDVESMPDACTQPGGFWDRHARPADVTDRLGPFGVAMGWRG